MVYTYHKIADLKNRARKIAREEGFARHEALDVAARRGGFQNYPHALDHLPQTTAPTRHAVEIVQRWKNRRTREVGMTTLSLELENPLFELVKPHHLVGYLGGCILKDEKTVIVDGFMRDQEESRFDVGRVARALQLMDATGLKPSRARKCYPKGNYQNRPPIADHDSCWFDPVERAYVLVTEPYLGSDAMRRDDHVAWENKYGWGTVAADWGSLHSTSTQLFLLSPAVYIDCLRNKAACLEREEAAAV